MPQVKTKITRAMLLDDLYKNLKMGTTSTTDILGRVMKVYLGIAFAGNGQIKSAVFRKKGQHMVHKTVARIYFTFALAV